MRLFVVSALALTIAACSGEAAGDKEGGEEGKGEETSSSDAASVEAFSPGEYTLVETKDADAKDNVPMELSIRDDDTFEVKEGDRMLAKGTYEVSEIEGGRKACFKEPEEDPEDEGNCFTVGAKQDDGTWVATNPGGETATLTYIEE